MSKTEEPALDRPVEGLSLTTNMQVAAVSILGQARVAGGVAIRRDCETEKDRRFEIARNRQLRAALDDLVATDSLYKWELSQDVVNILPRAGAPLLETRIAALNLVGEVSADVALQRIVQSPEVRTRAAQLGLNGDYPRVPPGRLDRVPAKPAREARRPITIQARNVSLREALNMLVGTQAPGVWVFDEMSCNHKRFYSFSLVSHGR